MEIKLAAVESSNVAAIGYDEESQTVRIQFKNGGIYDYANVPAVVNDELKKAPSVGSFVSRVIASKYKASKVGG